MKKAQLESTNCCKLVLPKNLQQKEIPVSEMNITQCLFFPEQFEKPVVVKFDEPCSSSDGGALLLKGADQKLDLTGKLSAILIDRRQAGKVRHTFTELIQQRVYGLASGYADANDAARIGNDPVFKMLLDRSPVDGESLSSQSTLSRFENSVGARALFRMGEKLAETVLERHRRRLKKKAKRVTIDLDPTDDPTHGTQQQTFFNAFYDTYCYLPVIGFVSFNDEPDQYLVAAVLRPGNATAKDGAIAILRRLIRLIRRKFPEAVIDVRLDGGFACPELFDFLDDERRLEYVCGLPKNSVLVSEAEALMKTARVLSEKKEETAHVYGECRYEAGTWDAERRVIIKAEVTRNPGREPKDNPRFVVTNKKQKPKRIYERAYCKRGEIENRLKELHHGMEIDRTSCTKFFANQFRVLLTAAAYVLLQEIRLQAKHTSLARAQVSTLREKLLKVSARIEESVRRIVIHLPATFAYVSEWTSIAKRIGATTG